MKLLSVNVSLPKEVPYMDKTATTGIFKEPVKGRIMLRTLNLEGDGAAVGLPPGSAARSV